MRHLSRNREFLSTRSTLSRIHCRCSLEFSSPALSMTLSGFAFLPGALVSPSPHFTLVFVCEMCFFVKMCINEAETTTQDPHFFCSLTPWCPPPANWSSTSPWPPTVRLCMGKLATSSFLPLTVDCRHKAAATGRIPKNFRSRKFLCRERL